MTPLNVRSWAEEVAVLMATRLGGRRRGEVVTLDRMIRRRGGALPRNLRKKAIILRDAEQVTNMPKIARQTDFSAAAQAHADLVAYLKPFGRVTRVQEKATNFAASVVFGLLMLAVGLSMDAFAVSICKGLALQRVSWKECCIAGAWFGGFQALMPLLGYLLGTQFEQFVTSVDHWIAFVLLGIIGGNMIREALSKDEDKLDGSLAFKTMLLLAIATSIDALAVGITFAFLPGTRIVPAVALIGSITFVFSAAGIRLGNVFGLRYKSKAEFAGGVILILLGTKILLEHLGVL